MTGSRRARVRAVEGLIGLVGVDGTLCGLISSCSVAEIGLGVGGVDGGLVGSVANRVSK
jgi:hypothetical protein